MIDGCEVLSHKIFYSPSILLLSCIREEESRERDSVSSESATHGKENKTSLYVKPINVLTLFLTHRTKEGNRNMIIGGKEVRRVIEGVTITKENYGDHKVTRLQGLKRIRPGSDNGNSHYMGTFITRLLIEKSLSGKKGKREN